MKLKPVFKWLFVFLTIVVAIIMSLFTLMELQNWLLVFLSIIAIATIVIILIYNMKLKPVFKWLLVFLTIIVATIIIFIYKFGHFVPLPEEPFNSIKWKEAINDKYNGYYIRGAMSKNLEDFIWENINKFKKEDIIDLLGKPDRESTDRKRFSYYYKRDRSDWGFTLRIVFNDEGTVIEVRRFD